MRGTDDVLMMNQEFFSDLTKGGYGATIRKTWIFLIAASIGIREAPMEKTILSHGKDYTALLPIFKELIIKSRAGEKDNLVFAGCPGPCYSMATLLGFGIKDVGLNLFFAANSDISQLWRLEYKENLGTIATSQEAMRRAKVLVLMSGLCTMPIELTVAFIGKALAPDGVIIGEAPASGLFEDIGWDKRIPFDFLLEFSMDNPRSFEVKQMSNRS